MDKQILLENNWQEKDISSLTEDKFKLLRGHYDLSDIKNISSQNILAGLEIFFSIKNNVNKVSDEDTKETEENVKLEQNKVEVTEEDTKLEQIKPLSDNRVIERLSEKEKVIFFKFLKQLKPNNDFTNEINNAMNAFNKKKKLWIDFNTQMKKGKKVTEILKTNGFVLLKKEFFMVLKQMKENPSKIKQVLNNAVNRQISAASGKLFLKIIFNLSSQISKEVQLKVKTFFSQWQPESEEKLKQKIKNKAIEFSKK